MTQFFLKKYWVIVYALLASPVISFLSVSFVRSGIIKSDSLWFYFVFTLTSFLFMLAVPIYLIKKNNKSPADYGFRLPENTTQALKISLITIFVTGIIIFLVSKNTSFQNFYSLKHNVTLWFLVEVLMSFFYFISEEFFFRGYLLNRLAEDFGSKAVVISNILFAIGHIDKPVMEVFFAFFYGIVLALISRKTKSFLPPALIHFLMALMLNLFILYQQ